MANWDFSDLHIYEKMLNTIKQQPGTNPKPIEDRIIEMKRKLRKESKTVNDRIIVCDYSIDGFVEKFPLPSYISGMEEADEYFMEYEYLECRPSAYDCTGQWFTSWYKIFRKSDGSFWAYHMVSVDC